MGAPWLSSWRSSASCSRLFCSASRASPGCQVSWKVSKRELLTLKEGERVYVYTPFCGNSRGNAAQRTPPPQTQLVGNRASSLRDSLADRRVLSHSLYAGDQPAPTHEFLYRHSLAAAIPPDAHKLSDGAEQRF